MHRRLLKVLSALAIAFVGTLSVAAQTVSPKSGEIRVKLQPELALKVASLPSIQTHGVKSTGIEPLDRAATQAKTVNIRPMLPYSAKFAAARAKYGLDRWFVVSFDETMNPEEVRSIYAATAGVERSEVITPMSLKEGTGTFRKVSAPTTAATSSSTLPFNDPMLGKQWHYQNFGTIPYCTEGADINLFEAWETVTGSSDVLVAIIDGGVDYTHEDLADNMFINYAELNGQPGVDDDGNGYVDDVYGFNFCTNEAKIYPHSHGTHVAGTVAAVNNNGIGVAGIAGGDGTADSGVKMISCQVFDSRSGTADGDFAAAIVYACEMGATIGQCSWGWADEGYFEEAVMNAIDYFTETAKSDNMMGGLLFFATGNDGAQGDYYPAAYEKVVGVAAMTSELAPASYSNHGSTVDIIAPGGLLDYGDQQGVLSTLPNNEYGYNEGTSMATPHVSGTAALVLAKYGSQTFTNEVLRTQILTSVNDFYGYGSNSKYEGLYGVGYLDAAKAVQMDQSGYPDAVSSFTLAGGQDYISITWTIPNSSDNNVNNHIIYYSTEAFTADSDLSKLSTKVVDTKFYSSGDEITVELEDLNSLTTYYVAIKAVNRWGNASALSEVKSVNTNAGPKMTVDKSSLTMAAVANSSIGTDTITIGNDDEGLLKWSVAKRTVSATLKSTRVLPGTISTSKITLAGTNTIQPAAVAAAAEYEAADYPAEIAYFESMYAMIGETDKSLPNSMAQLFKVDASTYPNGFNLTHLRLQSPESSSAYGENPRIEIYKGDTGISQASLLTTVNYSYFYYGGNIALTEQLYFSPGESFWVVYHFDPNQEGYPLPMGYTSDTSAGSGSFMSVDNGKTWTQLNAALKGSSYESTANYYVWAITARSINPDWSEALEITPASGSVRQGETQEVVIAADGTKFVNGTYKFNVNISTNESDARVVSIPTTLTVTGNLPDIVVPKVVDFGNILVGESKTVSVEVYNQGYGSFRGSKYGAGLYSYSGGISCSSDQFTAPSYVNTGFPARTTTTFEVTFTPTEAGTHSGTITFKDVDGNLAKVVLQGTATEPAKLTVSESTLDAVTLKLGEDASNLSFTITNDGKYPLEYVFPKFSDETIEGAATLHKFGYTVASTISGYDSFEYSEAPTLVGGKDITSKFTDEVYVSSAIDLGFSFPYYGQSYDKVYITSFGGIMFALNSYTFREPLEPDSYGVEGTGLISAYGRQLQMGPNSKIEYGTKDGKFVVNFKDVLGLDSNGGDSYTTISFHMTLSPSGDIEIFYDDYYYSNMFQAGHDLFCGINDPEVADVLTVTDAEISADAYLRYIYTEESTRYKQFETGTAVKFVAPQTMFVRTLTPAYGIVAPGESVDVSLTVSADETLYAGETYNDLTIVTNDPNQEISAIRVNAVIDSEGYAPVLKVEQTEIALGEVFRTSEQIVPVTVKNAGNNTLTVTSISLANNAMTVVQPEDMTIKPGLSLDIMVTVPTATEGDVADTLTITTDAGNATVAISATVIGCPEATLSFTTVEETVESGETLTKTLEISNNGNEPLVYSMASIEDVKVAVPERDNSTISYVYTTAVDEQTTFEWVDIETTGLGTQTSYRYYNSNDFIEVELPFEFQFYGEKYTKMYIYNSGFISFTKRSDNKEWPEPPSDFPGGSIYTNIIAPYWGLHTMNTTSTGGTYHYVTDDRAVVSFMEYGNSMNYGVCYQVILEKDGSFKFQYKAYDENSIIYSIFGLAGIANEDGSEYIKLAERYVAFNNAVSFAPVRQNTLQPNEKDEIGLTFNTDRFAGVYESSLTVNTNQPSKESIEIPVQLNITGTAVPEIPDSVIVEHVYCYQSTDYTNEMVQYDFAYDAPFTIANSGTATFSIYQISYNSPKEEVYDEWFGYTYENQLFTLMGYFPSYSYHGDFLGYNWMATENFINYPIEVGSTPVKLTMPMQGYSTPWSTPGEYEIPVSITYSFDGETAEEATVIVKFIVTEAPSINLDSFEAYAKADADDEVITKTLTISNEGQYKLDYTLTLDPTGVGEEVDDSNGDAGIAPMAVAKTAAPVALANEVKTLQPASVAGKIKAADTSSNLFEVPSNFDYTQALYYNALYGSTTTYFYGAFTTYDEFKASVHFTAPEEGINISHIYLPVLNGSANDATISIELISGEEPDGTEVIGSGEFTVAPSSDANTGQFYVVPLDKAVYLNSGEDFCVVVTFPEGLEYPAYVNEKEDSVTDGRYMAWTESTGWYDLGAYWEDTYGSIGYVLSCIETTPGESWIKLVDTATEGTVAVGESTEVKLQLNAASARLEKGNKAVLVIKSNDPNMPTYNYSIYFDVNGKPVIEGPTSKVYARENETTTIDFTISDPDYDDLTITVVDESGIANTKVVTANTYDTNAEITTDENGVVTVKGATMELSLSVELTPEYGQAGNYTMAVSVVDSKSHRVNAKVSYEVEHVNRAPIAVAAMTSLNVTVGQLSEVINFADLFEDPDGDDLTYTLSVPDNSMVEAYTTSTGVIFLGKAVGITIAQVTANDGNETVTANIMINVAEQSSINEIAAAGNGLVQLTETIVNNTLKVKSLVSDALRLEVFDMTGSMIYSNDVNANASDVIEINVGGSTTGFYILRATVGNRSESHRFIKQ